MDALKNFAYSLVATAPSPAASGTSLTVTAGQGALFPAAPFYVTCWPAGTQPLSTNAEIMRVTAVSTDTFTITRAQDGSTAQSIAVGYQIEQGINAGLLQQLMATSVYDPAAIAQQVVGTTATQTLTNKTLTSPTLTSPTTNDLIVTGLTGATAASRYVGATTSGAPTTGTFAVGDFIIDQTGKVWVCTTAGTPGTWTQVGGGSLTVSSGYLGSNVTLTNGTVYTVFTPSLAIGTYLVSFAYEITIPTQSTGSGPEGSMQIQTGTATATFDGLTSRTFANTAGVLNAAGSAVISNTVVVLVVVTAAGTIELQVQASGASTGTITLSGGISGFTTYSTVKVA